ncbi:MAG: glycosyltransferase [Christensenellaceae bacterium]
MIRVLWLCNMPLPFISEAAGIESSPFGGWLTGAYEGIKKNELIKLGICFPTGGTTHIHGVAQNVSYYSFLCSNKINETVCKGYIAAFKYILNNFKPDIVHIFGTERLHSYAMVKAFDFSDRTVINIQGLIGIYSQHYKADLPLSVLYGKTLRNILKNDSVSSEIARNRRIGYFEDEAIRGCKHIIGRTDWDKACSGQINPERVYHKCDETLRCEFYKHRWLYEKCKKHSIFVSQSNYPIKGFHYLLRAMPGILKRYPDTEIFTTGRSPFETPWYKLSMYQKYIKKLIRDNGLVKNVHYLGQLDEQGMCRQYLNSNVFVSCSTIENSPNSVGEAMILGVPVISSDVGGVKNILTHEVDGLIYQHDAVYMLAYYICVIFDDAEAAKQMGQKAHNSAARSHNSEKNGADLVNIYKEIYDENNSHMP